MNYKKIKDICEIKKGKKVFELEEALDNSIRYIQIDDLRNNNNIKFCSPDSRYVYVKKDDLIIAWDGANAGTIGFGLEGAIGSTLAKISVLDKDIFAPFLALYLQSKFDYFQRTATGATIPHISRAALENLDIPVFGIEKQKYIYNQMLKTKELIDKRQSQITALDELAKSLFLEMFGDPAKNPSKYPLCKLKNICTKITDGTHHSPPMVEKGIPYVSAKHLGKGYLDFFSNPAYISKEEHEKIYKRCDPINGDVLYIKDGATTGIAGINYYDFEFSMLSSLALIRPDSEQLINYYLVHYLNNDRIKENIISNMSGGAIKRLTIKKITDLSIVVPPIKLQQEFAEKVKKINQQKELLKSNLEEMHNLYGSLLQKAFKGELFQE
ncbi:restriction endonuclease subunit S [Lysinibacillus mangiferihumi]|uniref:Restriction endonuclease subunit S n=1 Tax=Lysinibacillus mangiferihumi TaxID=1130819 RepID=A0A4U2ZBW9_9BACI|nr:restriction endonuclease subunit S [Lysinibacillus mangiferihumi]TKI71927.1 restriction endonuclease subunit S [Lysinibacillus mangiferihumi]